MFTPVQRSLGTTLGVLALFGPLILEGRTQFRPVRSVANPYVNPFVAQRAYQAAVLGQLLRNQTRAAVVQNQILAANALRYQAILNTQAMLHSRLASGYGYPGYFYNPALRWGTLEAIEHRNKALGYASLLNGYGGLGLYSYGGFGTQWLINPYQGYLEGAADVTRANAEYYLTIQQAKLLRQEAIRSSLRTRRAFLEEQEYERAHLPDPEQLRQLAVARELNRARVNPPLSDIWSARSLNSLLRHLIARQAEGVKGPDVPLQEETLSHINLTTGDTRGNAGLLRDNGKLHWPLILKTATFMGPRENMGRLLRTAHQALQIGAIPDDATLNDLQVNYQSMQDILAAHVDNLTMDEYTEARRYLDLVHDMLTALKDRNIVNYFNGNWTPRIKSVAELVQFTRDAGLVFAPATPTDEAAYVALYYALAAFDAGMPREVHTRDNPGRAEIK